MRKIHYGGIPKEFRSPETASVVILPVPYDGTSTWVKGADKGPEAILEASENMELYDIDLDAENFRVGIYTDDYITEDATPKKMSQAVFRKVKKWLDQGKFIVTIGGEHSVSIGAIQACHEHYPDLQVLQIDAHTDLRPEYEGSKYNHACVMARVREWCPFVQVGIRSMDIIEKQFVPEGKVFYASGIRNGRYGDWISEVTEKLGGKVYVTIDLDGLDPSILPSTGTPEPSGLLYHEVVNLIRAVNEKHEIIGFDVVELCPNPNEKSSNFLASKLLYQIIGFVFKKNGKL
ncbi:MAG: agmatinase [Bacteroidetes bacterium]|nr:agmatinase [Bacteroidota bacterium]